jgi:hypothetical protein
LKGIVFNLLEEVVTDEHGAELWEQLLAESGVEGAYTSLGSYPDEDLVRLVSAASARLETDPQDVIRWFGREALPLLADRYPQFFESHSSTRDFLLTLNDIIHPEVRKLYPGADVPVFEHRIEPDGRLLMGYSSKRQLCAFGEGLIEGAAAHFGETVHVEQPECVRRGDPRCILEVSFGR